MYPASALLLDLDPEEPNTDPEIQLKHIILIQLLCTLSYECFI